MMEISVQEISVQDPWFSAIARGTKTVEGRLNKGKFAEMRAGTVLSISKSVKSKSSVKSPISSSKSSPRPRTVVAIVTKVVRYPNFEQYLSCEGLNRTLPGLLSIKEGVDVYRQFYSAQDEQRYGVVAVHVTLLNPTRLNPTRLNSTRL